MPTTTISTNPNLYASQSLYKFKPGNKVLLPKSYYNPKGDFIGTVIQHLSSTTIVAWEKDFFIKYDLGSAIEYETRSEHIRLLPKDYQHRTKLERKCQKLWNESKWVQENPQFAY